MVSSPDNLTDLLSVYNRIPGMLMIIDRQDRVIGVSDRWLTILDYRRADVLGRSSREFVPATSASLAELIYVPEFFQQGHLEEVECQFLKKAGGSIDVVFAATADFAANGELVHTFVAIRDITRRKRVERLLQAVSEGTAGVTGGDFFRSLTSYLSQVLDAPYVFVTECTDRVLPRVRTLASLEHHVFVESAEWDVRGTTCEGVLEGKICYYPDRLGQLYPEYLNKRQSYIGVPIYDSQQIIVGHLAVFDIKPTDYDPQEVAVLQIFAARAGAELERKRSEDKLNQLNEQLKDYNLHLEQVVAERTREIERRHRVTECLRDMVAILNSNRPLSEILDYILNTATQLLGTPNGAIYSLDADQKKLAVQATCGLSTAYATALKFSLEQRFLGQAILQRQPMVISNWGAMFPPQPVEQESAKPTLLAENYQTLLAIPLLRQGSTAEEHEVYGGIALYYPEERTFTDEEIGLAVAFGAQAALAIQNARLHAQVEQMAVSEERSRLARELHDSVTQSLYSLTLLAEGYRRMANTNRLANVGEALTELGEIGQQALKEMRLLVYELRPPSLERAGLLGALHERLQTVEKRAGVEARLIATEHLLNLPITIETGLYRIAQEALNNALKHAGASAVTVRIAADSQSVHLEVTDNGKGFDQATLAENRGIGLSSMQERTEKLGGTLTLNSLPGEGTTVRIQVPLT